MKQFLLIFFIVILSLALLGVGLYFMDVPLPLGHDFYANRGAEAMASDNYDTAIARYTRAWESDNSRWDTAIKLGQCYAETDNYTKAEYILVSAITKNPDIVDLYATLSRTYVAQDKLLDAEAMLSRTSSQIVADALEIMRPKAPTISPEAGYYANEIDISLTHADGAAYLSIDGEFPSLATDSYTAPITLPAEESIAIAVVVSDDGLVSPVSTSGYTIGGIVEDVTFRDQALGDFIHETLGLEDSQAVTTEDMWSITQLDLPDTITDLTDLAICRSLTQLSIHNVYGMDFSVLSQLKSLQTLDLSSSTVSTKGLQAIGSLPNLTTLNLASCGLTDISPLATVTQVKDLNLSGNAITTIDALANLPALTHLNLSTNQIDSITPLAPATGLMELNISSNLIPDLGSLKDKTSLTSLIASDNVIASVAELSQCTALTNLDLSYNQLTDVEALGLLTNLETLNLSTNQVATLPDFTGHEQLHIFKANNTQITEVTALEGLAYLNYVAIDHTLVADLTPISTCNTLVMVDAFATPITSLDVVDAMVEAQIIVNYDPTFAIPEEEEEEAA